MSLLRRLRRFVRAERGLAAIEFALIAPMMILLLFGSVDLIETLGANKRVQNVSASLADVVARDDAVSDDEVDGLWAAINLLMYPNAGAGVQLRVTCVSIVNATTAEVVWSEARGITALSGGDSVDLPDQMMTPGSSVIMAETVYPYTAPLGFLHTGSRDLRHTAYRRSRLVDPIPRVP